MPRMLCQTTGARLLLATPVFGHPTAAYAHSLFQAARSVDADLAIYAGDCHVDDARNVICREFLQSKADELVFIDADIRFEPEALKSLLAFDADIVGATYPFKQENTGFPVRHLDGALSEDRQGLIEVLGLPTGFLRIKRKVIETLANSAPHFLSKGENSGVIPLIFERMLDGQSRLGGDTAFCVKAREAGYKVMLAPEIELEHGGEHYWVGSWAHYQRCERFGALEAGLLEIQHGRQTSKTYRDMVQAWGNEWSVDGAMLACVTELAAGKRVLELGSGLSSLAMAAAGAEVHAVEHLPEWSQKVRDVADKCGFSLTVYDVDLAAYDHGTWYDLSITPAIPFDLVIIDGPPRSVGNRAIAYQQLNLNDVIVVVDDMNDLKQRRSLDDWSASIGRTPVILGQSLRQFAVVPKAEQEYGTDKSAVNHG